LSLEQFAHGNWPAQHGSPSHGVPAGSTPDGIVGDSEQAHHDLGHAGKAAAIDATVVAAESSRLSHSTKVQKKSSCQFTNAMRQVANVDDTVSQGWILMESYDELFSTWFGHL
jgi:hypothetical protein